MLKEQDGSLIPAQAYFIKALIKDRMNGNLDKHDPLGKANMCFQRSSNALKKCLKKEKTLRFNTLSVAFQQKSRYRSYIPYLVFKKVFNKLFH